MLCALSCALSPSELHTDPPADPLLQLPTPPPLLLQAVTSAIGTWTLGQPPLLFVFEIYLIGFSKNSVAFFECLLKTTQPHYFPLIPGHTKWEEKNSFYLTNECGFSF